MTEKLSCPRCHGERIVKAGKHIRLKGVEQRWECKDCGTTFTNTGYYRGKHHLAFVQYAVALYQNGYSTKRVSEELQKRLGQTVSKTTVWKWVKMLGAKLRKQNSGDQKHKLVRDLVEVGIITTVRFASSYVPEKITILDNVVIGLDEKQPKVENL